jgi:SPP1 family predicted phage head-tail adaptor
MAGPLDAGRLRHRVTIERPVETQDPETGAISIAWEAVWSDVPAAVEPRSGREFLAAQQLQAEISTLITFRYREGLTPKMRILHGSRIYNPAALLHDPDAGLEYIVAACGEGVNQG